MTSIERHERVCTERWSDAQHKLEQVRQLAATNFESSATDRRELRAQIETLQAKATSVVTRLVSWLLVSMAGGLSGAIWFIATHKWG